MNRILLFFLAIFLSITCFSQKKEISVKEYFGDAEYFFVAEEYVDALQEYQEVYRQGYENNANINYHIGVCYLNIPGQKHKAIPYLKKAAFKSSDKYVSSSLQEKVAPLDAFLYLGNAFRIQEQLDSAVVVYNMYLEKIPEEAHEERSYAQKQIEACYIGREFISAPKSIEFTSVSSLVNNSNANHNCVVSEDGSTMVFMTKLPFYEAVFMSIRRGENWTRPINITPQLMSDGDQYVTGISSDGKQLLLAKSDQFDSDIYLSVFEDGEWSKSKPISKAINSRYWESHASFSNDGKQIYFASNRRESLGQTDIFVSTLMEDGNWSEPVNLGSNINTTLNEDTPFITADGKSLYFSSQGHLNMGGYDYFVCHMTDSGWGGPENIGYPLSTTDEDLFFYPYNNGENAYISKILTDGAGNWDIYKLTFVEEPEIVEELEIIEEAEVIEKLIDTTPEVIEPEGKIAEFEAKPILFGFDNYTLESNSKTQVSPYIKLMKEYPELYSVITGYTDAIGPAEYNLRLSERRAAAIMEFMVTEEIESDRIQYKGLGETNFIARNENADGSDNPEGRKFNRRAEITISGIDSNKLMVKKINLVPASLKVKNK